MPKARKPASPSCWHGREGYCRNERFWINRDRVPSVDHWWGDAWGTERSLSYSNAE
jgi:hypothetical protein